ncbi:MAG: DNA polymerase III subunit epsilon [Betaproteobacteria bacterium]|nr:DNA polymerase III subunit epsilon [Betaproteobacteria bacterium]
MRQVVLDTETTGLEVSQGHRIIELAAVEVINRRLTGNTFQRYVNPDREIDAGARDVHGISIEFLQDKPRFKDVAGELIEFIRGTELVIHNAPFDVGFLNAELALAGRGGLKDYCGKVTDTLRIAKDLNPGKRANLDALCERYQVGNSHRTVHGALLDARLLAEVFLAMTRGQDSLVMDVVAPSAGEATELAARANLNLALIAATQDELHAHERMLDDIEKGRKAPSLWRKLGPQTVEVSGEA